MIGNITEHLPDIFPSGSMRVTDEEHLFEVFETQSGPEPELKYVLDKSPINRVESLTATVDGQKQELVEGTDYQLADDVNNREENFTYNSNDSTYPLLALPDQSSLTIVDEFGNSYTEGTDYRLIEDNNERERIIEWFATGSTPNDNDRFTVSYTRTIENASVDFGIGGDNPDAGTVFYVDYYADSIISRFIDSHEQEIEKVEADTDHVIQSHFVDEAEGQELDELGKLFGELGKRRGRTDSQYRIYLKSIVQSFAGRGTLSGIKFAVASGIDVTEDDIQIFEDFENNEYEIQITNFADIEFSENYTFEDGKMVYDLDGDLIAINGNNDIRDESGDIYTVNNDYEFIDIDGDGNFERIKWLDASNTPDDGEEFTVYFPIQSDTIVTLAELADPSGVTFVATRYRLEGDSVVVEGDGLTTALQHTGIGDGDTIGDGALGTRDNDIKTIHNVNGETLIASTTGVQTLEEFGLGAANIGFFTLDGDEEGVENSQTTSGETVLAEGAGTTTVDLDGSIGDDTLGTSSLGTSDENTFAARTTDGDTALIVTSGTQTLEEFGLGAANIGVFTPAGNEEGFEDSQTTSGDTVTASTAGTSDSTITNFGVGSDTIGAGSI